MDEIGTAGNHPFTIVMPRMIGEAWQDYAERCRQLANVVANLGPKPAPSTALVHNPDTLHGVVQVSEHAYGIVTPGYQPTEETGSERDTHFQGGFAKLLFDRLVDEGIILDSLLDDELLPIWRENTHRLIARAAYDLVYFLLDKAEYHSGSFDTGWGTPDEIHEVIRHFPDMTAQSETEKE